MQHSVALFSCVFLSLGLQLHGGELRTIATAAAGFVPQTFRMADTLQGWAIETPDVWHTVDGGRSWAQIQIKMRLTAYWGVTPSGGAWFLAQSNGMSGEFGILVITREGGKDFRRVSCQPDSDCIPEGAAFVANGDRGLLFGLASTTEPYVSSVRVFATRDDARTWTPAAAPPESVYRDLFETWITGPNAALVLANCSLYVTKNFGTSWIKTPASRVPNQFCGVDTDIPSVHFIAPGRGWLRTSDGWTMITEDGGQSWKLSSLGHRDFFPVEVSWQREWIGFANGRRGLMIINSSLFSTNDGGNHWELFKDSAAEEFWSVSCASQRCFVSSSERMAEFLFDP